jgi:hypothetical protein
MLPSRGVRTVFTVSLVTLAWSPLTHAFEVSSNIEASSAIERHICGNQKMSCARRTPVTLDYSIARWQSLFARGEAMRAPNQASTHAMAR